MLIISAASGSDGRGASGGMLIISAVSGSSAGGATIADGGATGGSTFGGSDGAPASLSAISAASGFGASGFGIATFGASTFGASTFGASTFGASTFGTSGGRNIAFVAVEGSGAGSGFAGSGFAGSGSAASFAFSPVVAARMSAISSSSVWRDEGCAIGAFAGLRSVMSSSCVVRDGAGRGITTAGLPGPIGASFAAPRAGDGFGIVAAFGSAGAGGSPIADRSPSGTGLVATVRAMFPAVLSARPNAPISANRFFGSGESALSIVEANGASSRRASVSVGALSLPIATASPAMSRAM